MAQAPSSQAPKGIVKQVLSGDCVVIRGQPKGGPPPERTLALTNITAPKLGRRANPNMEGSTETKDEPYAWESREFLRKLLVGQEVTFTVEHKVGTSGREYGHVWINKGGELTNVTELLVAEGLVEVRQVGSRPSEELVQLTQLEESVKTQEKGKWRKERAPDAVRSVSYNMDNLAKFVEKNRGKEIDAIVEYVRDGSTMRVILLPSFEMVTVMMSGIKCPTIKREGDKEAAEPVAAQAKFFTEARLLQRDIKVLVEGVTNQNMVATIIHPAGNIAELLVREGYARCVDWSMGMVTRGRDKLRAAERQAKEKQLRIWKEYKPVTTTSVAKNFTGKVMEVVNGDALVVKCSDSQYKKIFFSSLRPPRPSKDDNPDHQLPSGQRVRPLYDVPYMFEAREFLRKKLIGKKVNLSVDYIKPAQDTFPEKTCCTVIREGINIAEALISKGLATCLWHRQDDDHRSPHYDDLRAAEERAAKNSKGLHSRKDLPIHRVADLSGDPNKAKQFLPFLQRAGRTTALVEFVASGSRLRLFLPKDTCLITFLLAGISCPRASRPMDGKMVPAEPFGQEAHLFTKELVLQREVDVEVEACDKGGNFIGWLFVDEKNLAVTLVEDGLSKVLPQAERSPYSRQLFELEERAKTARKKLWEDYVEPEAEKEEDEEDEDEVGKEREQEEAKKDEEKGEGKPTENEHSVAPTEKKSFQHKVVVTEVESCVRFWAQNVDQGPQLEQMMDHLRSDMAASPPLPGSFTPRKGAMCTAQYTDKQWYRARVEKIVSPSEIQVLFLDYGNRLTIPVTSAATLPSGYSSTPPQAKEYCLACVIAPTDEDWQKDSKRLFEDELAEVLLMNIEYRSQGQEYVTLCHSDDKKTDIAERLISNGLLAVEKRREKKLVQLVKRYVQAEKKARDDHVNIWQYGDYTADDANEFGYRKA